MRAEQLADHLFNQARTHGQSACKITSALDVDATRVEVRRLARDAGVKIRTGILDGDVLAVVRLDADLWDASAAVMRDRLLPPET